MKKLFLLLLSLGCFVAKAASADTIAFSTVQQFMDLADEARHFVDLADEARQHNRVGEAMSHWFEAFKMYQQHLGEYAQAFDCANKLEDLARTVPLESHPEVLLYYAAIAELYLEVGDVENSMNLLEYVTSNPTEAEKVNVLSRAYYNIGVIQIIQRKYEEAETMFHLGVYYDQLSEQQSHAPVAWGDMCWGGVGVIRYIQQDFVEAAETLSAVHAVLFELGEQHYSTAGNFAAWLSMSYAACNRSDSALHYANLAGWCFDNAPQHDNVHRGLHYLAMAKYETLKGNAKASTEWMMRAYEASEQRKLPLHSSWLQAARRTPHPFEDDVPSRLSNIPLCYALIVLLFVLIFIPVGMKLYRCKRPTAAAPRQASSTDATPHDVMLFEQITHYLEESQAYLSSAFDLKDLCDAMKQNDKNVSRAINRAGDMNFRQLVNSYRVKEVVRLMGEQSHHDHFTLDAIATDVGFTDRSSLWRAFKQIYHMSPKEYLEQMQKR
jgi:AraC-like DNA-binding protein